MAKKRIESPDFIEPEKIHMAVFITPKLRKIPKIPLSAALNLAC
jgi:hypothetical protein